MIKLSTQVAATVCVLAVGSAPLLAEDKPLVVVAPWAVSALTPPASGAAFQRMGVTEPLTEPGADGKVAGLLASSWSANEALTEWRFAIRESVRFHDGQYLTAQVVADNLNAFAADSALSRVPVESISASETDVIITLSRPFASLPAYLAHWSTGIVSPKDLDGAADGSLAGTGFYRIDQLTGEEEFTVNVFEDYWGDPPGIETARYISMGDAETRFSLLASGEAHLSFGLLPAAIRRGETSTEFDVNVEPIARIRAFKVNAAAEPFADRDVREAISLAIDRQGIATAVLGNPETAASQLFPPGIAGWHDTSLSTFAYDPLAAAERLETAGWIMGENGIRQRNGEPLAFEVFAYDARPELPDIATAVIAQLREVGIDATMRLGQWTEIPERHDDGTLEMAIFSDNFAYVPDPIGQIAANYTNGGGAWGAMGWRNAEFEANVAAYQATAVPERRAALRDQIVATLHEEQPVITVAWYDEVYGTSSQITGFAFDPYEMSYNLDLIRWRDAP